jgi:serine/threonine protein kinase
MINQPFSSHSPENFITIQIDGCFLMEKLEKEFPSRLLLVEQNLIPANLIKLSIDPDKKDFINLSKKQIVQIKDNAKHSIYLRIEDIARFLTKQTARDYNNSPNDILVDEISKELSKNYLVHSVDEKTIHAIVSTQPSPASSPAPSPTPSPINSRGSSASLSPALRLMTIQDPSKNSSVRFPTQTEFTRAMDKLFDQLNLNGIEEELKMDPDNLELHHLKSQIDTVKSIVRESIWQELLERGQKDAHSLDFPTYQKSWVKGNVEIELNHSLKDILQNHRGVFIDPAGHCCMILPTDFENIGNLENGTSPTMLGAGSFKTFIPVYDLKTLTIKALGFHNPEKISVDESISQLAYRMKLREPLREMIAKLSKEYPSAQANTFPFFLPYAVLLFEGDEGSQVAELMEFGQYNFGQIILGKEPAELKHIAELFTEDVLCIYTALEKLQLITRDNKLENILQTQDGKLALSDLDEIIYKDDLISQTLEKGYMPVFGTLQYIRPAFLSANLLYASGLQEIKEAEKATDVETKNRLLISGNDIIDRALKESVSQKNQMWSVALCIYQCYTGGHFPLCIQRKIDEANAMKEELEQQIQEATANWTQDNENNPEIMQNPEHPAHQELATYIGELTQQSILSQTKLFAEISENEIQREFQNTDKIPILALVRSMLLGEFDSFEPTLHKVVHEKILQKK